MFDRRLASLFILASALILRPVSCASPGASLTPVPLETPAEVLAARDAALVYLIGHYGEQAPWRNLIWLEEEITPDGLVGQVAYRYAAGDWVITISHGTAAPEAVIYSVAGANQTTGFQWEGEVDATGRVTGAPEGVVAARDVALAYLSEFYGEEASTLGLVWAEEFIPPEGWAPSGTYPYRAGEWWVTVYYAGVEPELYQVFAANETTGFQWEGTVDSEGTVTEQPAVGGQPVVCWYGRVVSLPDGAQFDDYLALNPEGAGEVGVEGTDAEIEGQLQALRDEEGPGSHAHFWGRLTCDVPDVGGCQLLVARLRPEGPGAPIPDPEPVEGWEGRIVGTPSGAQFDDYFVLAGDFPVGFGIGSSDPQLATQLESLRDTQTTVRVWGQVTCPAIDSFGTHIVVTRIEVVP
ncbi:MAG TPA: hypothetical protein VM075_07990 [Anaerolineae bacterium]|nr:hypothetical protein [Anaerolineae bacterium]